MGRDTAYWYRRGRGCLWAMAGLNIRGPGEKERVVEFANMSDEELRQDAMETRSCYR